MFSLKLLRSILEPSSVFLSVSLPEKNKLSNFFQYFHSKLRTWNSVNMETSTRFNESNANSESKFKDSEDLVALRSRQF